MIKGKHLTFVIISSLLLGLVIARSAATADVPAVKPNNRPALSVSIIKPTQREIPLTVSANGSIAAWQEAIIGAEIGDMRLSEVRCQVGENVRKGQVLAVFADESVLVAIKQAQALLAEAEATLSEAKLNSKRAREVSGTGVISAQQASQYFTSEKTALAKLQSAQAQLDTQLLRQKHTKVLASDDGTISSRTATLGAVVSPNQELFRLIRQNRLEWRAEVTGTEMARLKTGDPASITLPSAARLEGKVRSLAPTLDMQTRNGLVYVDLPSAAKQGLRAGMFAQGEFYLGSSPALTIPQTALSLREGFSYVFKIGDKNQDQASVTQVKVTLGRRSGDDYEILSGISPEDQLVANGSAFLTDGDHVKVVNK